MMERITIAFVLLLALLSPCAAQFNGCRAGICPGTFGAGFNPSCPLALGVLIPSTCPTVTIPNSTTYQADVSSISSLVGYWKMEDAGGCTSLVDSSVNNNPATIGGTVTCGSTALITGQSATSALFNGSSGYAQLGSSGGTTFNWEYTQPWTLECLIKPNSPRTGSSVNQELWAKVGTSSPFRGIETRLIYNGSIGSKNVLAAILQGSASDTLEVVGSTDLANGSVWHIVISYTGSGVASGFGMYVNGSPETITTVGNSLGGTTIINTTNPTLGAWGNGSQFFFPGNMQECAMYNVAVGATTASLISASNILSANKPAFHTSLSLGNSQPATVYHPRVILDAQVAGDVAQVSSMLLLDDFRRRGEINLLGIIVNNVNSAAADAAYAITNQVLGSTPQSFIGAWQGSVPTTNNAATSLYSASVSSTFGTGQARTSYTDGIQQYRALLAAQPNNSVVIVAIGYSTTLDGLLTSAANAGGDGLPSGATLIAQKVIRLVIGAGCYPASSTNCLAGNNPEFNLANGPAANASDVFANWPTEVITVGIELAGAAGTNTGNIYDGPASVTPTSTAIALAWNLWGSTPRTSWDALTAWCAIRQAAGGCVPAGMRGTNTVNSSTGANTWTTPTPTNAPTTYERLSAANAAFISQFNLMYSALPNPF